jgi:hypothetical protein
MSGEPEQEYFSGGITDDIITDLSKVADLLVIARNSSFAYKGKNVDIRTVGRALATIIAGEEAGTAGFGRSHQQNRPDCMGSSRSWGTLQPLPDRSLLTATANETTKLVTAECDAR